jgi:hypothetical protein
VGSSRLEGIVELEVDKINYEKLTEFGEVNKYLQSGLQIIPGPANFHEKMFTRLPETSFQDCRKRVDNICKMFRSAS